MARSQRQAQRSREALAIRQRTDSVIIVDIDYSLSTLPIAAAPTPPETHPLPPSTLAPNTRALLLETHPREVPYYDPVRGELWFLGVLIKKLKGAADNQRKFLCCFQEQKWEGPLFDPLEPNGVTDPHKRFFDTVDSINGHHANEGWLVFVTDGGETVDWTEGPKAIALPALRQSMTPA